MSPKHAADESGCPSARWKQPFALLVANSVRGADSLTAATVGQSMLLRLSNPPVTGCPTSWVTVRSCAEIASKFCGAHHPNRYGVGAPLLNCSETP